MIDLEMELCIAIQKDQVHMYPPGTIVRSYINGDAYQVTEDDPIVECKGYDWLEPTGRLVIRATRYTGEAA